MLGVGRYAQARALSAGRKGEVVYPVATFARSAVTANNVVGLALSRTKSQSATFV